MPKNLPILLNNPFFTLALTVKKKKAFIYIKFKTQKLATDDSLETLYFLENSIPTIFQSMCYNDFNLPFRKEVVNTELGHLYEHILLEYISLLHSSKRKAAKIFRGYTSWDWRKNDRGLFKIDINVGEDDVGVLIKALILTSDLMKDFLNFHSSKFNPYPDHQIPLHD